MSLSCGTEARIGAQTCVYKHVKAEQNHCLLPSLSSSIPFWYPLAAVAPGPFISASFIHRLPMRSGCCQFTPVSTMHTLTCNRTKHGFPQVNH